MAETRQEIAKGQRDDGDREERGCQCEVNKKRVLACELHPWEPHISVRSTKPTKYIVCVCVSKRRQPRCERGWEVKGGEGSVVAMGTKAPDTLLKGFGLPQTTE